MLCTSHGIHHIILTSSVCTKASNQFRVHCLINPRNWQHINKLTYTSRCIGMCPSQIAMQFLNMWPFVLIGSSRIFIGCSVHEAISAYLFWLVPGPLFIKPESYQCLALSLTDLVWNTFLTFRTTLPNYKIMYVWVQIALLGSYVSTNYCDWSFCFRNLSYGVKFFLKVTSQ